MTTEIMQATLKSNIIAADLKEIGINSIDDVTIGNKAAYKDLFDENTPFEFICAVKLGPDALAHPNEWTEVELTKEWASSFAEAVNTVPKPLYVSGHADQGIHPKTRAISDGYVTGAKVHNSLLLLRNSLPKGDTDEKRALVQQTMKEIKAKMLSTSTADYMKLKIEKDEATDMYRYVAIESVKGQSNALVEADQTGSEAEIILTSFKQKSGVADDFENNDEKGERGMDKVPTNGEMFTSLKNQLDSGRLALSEVAESLGVEVMTTKQKTALKRLNDAESKVGDITEFVAKYVQEREAAFVSLKEAKIKEKFVSEELIEIATPLFSLKAGSAEEIDAEVERIAALKVFANIQGKIASSLNMQFAGSGSDIIDESNSPMEG